MTDHLPTLEALVEARRLVHERDGAWGRDASLALSRLLAHPDEVVRRYVQEHTRPTRCADMEAAWERAMLEYAPRKYTSDEVKEPLAAWSNEHPEYFACCVIHATRAAMRSVPAAYRATAMNRTSITRKARGGGGVTTKLDALGTQGRFEIWVTAPAPSLTGKYRATILTPLPGGPVGTFNGIREPVRLMAAFLECYEERLEEMWRTRQQMEKVQVKVNAACKDLVQATKEVQRTLRKQLATLNMSGV